MSTPDERGALGKRFHDLPSAVDNPELSWESMAKNILPPEHPEEKPRRKRLVFWWFFFGFLLAISTGYFWLSEVEKPVAYPEAAPVVVATSNTNAPESSECNPPNLSSIEVAEVKSLMPHKKVVTTPKLPSLKATVPVLPNLKSADGNKPSALGPETIKTALTTPRGKAKFKNPEKLRQTRRVVELGPLEIEPLMMPGFGFDTVPPILLPSFDTITESFHTIAPREVALSLMVGAVDFQSRYRGNAPWLANEQNEVSGQLSIGYERFLGYSWFIRGGIDVRQYRFRTAFENTDTDARIYQPGTVDTIFRNLTTGEERIVTTDTVGGTRIRRFGNDNGVLELGLPLLLGRRWKLGHHVFRIAAGPRLGIVLDRDGRTLVETNAVTDLQTAPQFSHTIQWSARLEASYAYRLTPSISILGSIGGEASFTNWSGATELKQRPRLLNGQLGLRFKIN